MKNFFISYSNADQTSATWIAWQLEQAGYTTVLQAWDFRPGGNFVLEMQRAKAQAKRTIAVLSPAYLAGRFTQAEWAAAFAEDPTGEKGALLPVRVEECELEGLLAPIIYVDLVGLTEEAATAALLGGVERGRVKPSVAPPFPADAVRSVARKPSFPVAHPEVWNVPHRRKPDFTGRESLLQALRVALTSGQPITLTQAISGLGDEPGAGELAEELGDLPLALEQAAAYIERTGESFSGYLGLFRSRRKHLWKTESRPGDYPKTVATTWSLSIERAREEAPAAYDLLMLCAYLGPDSIPKDLLREGKKSLPRSLSAVLGDTLQMDQAIAALLSHSLIQVEEDSLSVHRLVQAVSRDKAEEDAQKVWAKAALRLVSGAFPDESQDVRTWPQCKRLLPHALAVADHAQRLKVLPKKVGWLLNVVGTYLRGRGDLAEAKAACERALAIGEKALGPDHPDVAMSLENMAELYRKTGRVKEADTLEKRVAAIRAIER